MLSVNRILLSGGSTGGHVYPLVAVAEEIQNQVKQTGARVELQFIGQGELLKQLASEMGVNFYSILAPKWRRYFSLKNFIDLFKFPVGFLQSLFYVWLYMPDLIFAKGGYASFLPLLASRLLLIPIVIHESDAVPGQTNRFFAKAARKVFLAFDAARSFFKSGQVEVVGNPLRSGLIDSVDQGAARTGFNLDSAKPTILVTGASQGAKIINDVLLLSVVELVKKYQVIHQTGPNNFTEVNGELLKIVREGKEDYGQQVADNYRIYPAFDLEQMKLAYAAADVIVSRAGSAIFEVAALAKPAIIIPLKNSAGNHQLANAREFAKFGAIVIEESNLSQHLLVREIDNAYQKKTELGLKIKQFAKPEAGSIIARQLLSRLKV